MYYSLIRGDISGTDAIESMKDITEETVIGLVHLSGVY